MLVTLMSLVSRDPNSLTVNYIIVYAKDLAYIGLKVTNSITAVAILSKNWYA